MSFKSVPAVKTIYSNDNIKNEDKFEPKVEDKLNADLTFENVKSNIVIEEFDKQTIKPRKRPNMFRRHF